MSGTNETTGIDASGLRERLPQKPDAPQKAESVETAQDAVKALNEQEAKQDKDEKDKKTYGRTPDGTGAYTTAKTMHVGELYRCSCQVASIRSSQAETTETLKNRAHPYLFLSLTPTELIRRLL